MCWKFTDDLRETKIKKNKKNVGLETAVTSTVPIIKNVQTPDETTLLQRITIDLNNLPNNSF